jgi:DNA-binding GntR family transcriptional regulator
MIDLCGNPFIRDAYSQVGFRIQALRSRLSNEARLNRLSINDHREMLKLIKSRDVPSLQQALRDHIQQTKQSYLDVLDQRDLLAEHLVSP